MTIRKQILGLMAAALLLGGCGTTPPSGQTPAAPGPTAPLPTLPFPQEQPSEQAETSGQPSDAAGPAGNLQFHEGWARIPFNFGVFGGYGADQINDVVAGGPGVVAVGIDVRDGDINGAAWYSADGVDWFRVTESPDLSGPGVQSIAAVAAGPGGLVAVGLEKIGEDQNAAVWFSEDGISWRRVPARETEFGGAGSQAMEDVVAFGAGFAAVGFEKADGEVRGAAWLSADGFTWRRVPHSEEMFGGAGQFTTFRALLADGGTLVAAGSVEPTDDLDVDGGAWISTDGGETWMLMPGSADLGDPGPVRFQLISGIARGDDGYLLAATEQNLAGSPSGEFVNALVWSSGDGNGWERVFDHKPDLYQQGLLDVIASAFGYFAAGYEIVGEQSQAAVWYSEDGLIWGQVPPAEAVFGGPGIQRITALAEAGPGIVAVGYTTENGEQDGAVWIYDGGVRKSE